RVWNRPRHGSGVTGSGAARLVDTYTEMVARMNSATVETHRIGWTVYYGWVVLTVAALAMVGTLPGRTQGLGLITEPLLRDLGVDRVRFAQINFVATLTGSAFCFGIGGLVDRLGSRL